MQELDVIVESLLGVFPHERHVYDHTARTNAPVKIKYRVH
jgi:hypothetical protein